ncbi:hypothetical protein BKA63DRAFT_195296 [Paraphoma chrysanthemicola]|nr:hypothetical protein BKA63DRAFT_195296 [Paraphoma chrysanthemicola]
MKRLTFRRRTAEFSKPILSKISDGETEPGLEKSFMNPLPVLEEMHPYSISMLALLATHGGVMSGSQVIPKGSTRDSDFDIYQPFHPHAIEDVMHVLSFASIRWNNFLSDNLDEVAHHQTTIVPYDTIWSLVEALSEQPSHPLEGLLEYLQDRFKGSDLDSAILDDFLCCFNSEVQECRKRMGQEGWYEPKETQKIWIYKGQETRTCDIPQSTLDVIQLLGMILLECYPAYVHTGENFEDCVRNLANEVLEHEDDSGYGGSSGDQSDKNDHVPKIQIKAVMKEWDNLGLRADHMRKIIIHRIHQVLPYFSNREVEFLFSLVFDSVSKPWSEPTAKGEFYGLGFRILRGVLPDGRKVQVMLLPLNTTPIRTVLGFYATHPMGILSGTLGAHFYFDTAVEQISETLDFEDDPRHPWALKAIDKMKLRDWKFKEISSKLEYCSASAERVKVTGYEHIYKEALQKYAFITYTWTHKNRKICNIRNIRPPREYGNDNLLEWVHTELQGHDRVIPDNQWKKKDSAKIALDIWFGGIKINPNWRWGNGLVLHRSWASSSWHNKSWIGRAWKEEYRLP